MLRKFWWLAFVMLLPLIPLSAQDSSITLRTFINPAYQVQGLRPQNWSETTRYSGVYRPETNLADRTVLVIQAGEMEVADVLASLVSLYDLSAPPSRIARNRSNTLLWSIYNIERRVGSQTLYVDIAIAESNERVFLVLMQTNQPTYDQLHEDVFLAVIASIEPVESTIEENMQVGGRETVMPTLSAETTPVATAESTVEVTPEITPEATESSSE